MGSAGHIQGTNLMTLDEFIAAHEGHGVDFDGRYGDQCVDLFRAYVKEVLGLRQPPGVMGAADLWQAVSLEDWECIPNTPADVPLRGDVVIWDRRIGPYGHVAIFLEGDESSFVSLDQNWPTGRKVSRQGHSYRAVKGWLRPRARDWIAAYLLGRGIDVRDEASAREQLDALFAGHE